MRNRKKLGIYILIGFVSFFFTLLIIDVYNRPIRFRDSFSGTLVKKKFISPGSTTFYIKNNERIEKKVGGGFRFYEMVKKGDSIIKFEKNDTLYVYRKKDNKYVLVGKGIY